MRPSRWLVYALGGGLGHATRGLALARAAAKRGHQVRVLVNATRFPVGAEPEPGVTLERVEGGRPEVERALERLWAERFDAWVVDAFPRGLAGELVGWFERMPKARAWIHRDLVPAYAQRPEVLEAARHYPLSLVPGDDEEAPLAAVVGARRTVPWLIRDRAELCAPAEARRRLGAREGQRVVVVSGAGTAAEAEEMARLATALQASLGPQVVVRWVSPEDGGGGHWPLLELLPGVDVLVGAGGYHTVNEARATGTPLVALARERLYDRQRKRLRPDEYAEGPGEVLRKVGALLGGGQPRAPVPDYGNGAHQAVRWIEELVGR
ncbi:MAG TPA: hypothetical protein VK447_21345 [Myxococcaceae bacterium]|nr:hypothetical protein [Myxococcaceae bacterium]